MYLQGHTFFFYTCFFSSVNKPFTNMWSINLWAWSRLATTAKARFWYGLVAFYNLWLHEVKEWLSLDDLWVSFLPQQGPHSNFDGCRRGGLNWPKQFSASRKCRLQNLWCHMCKIMSVKIRYFGPFWPQLQIVDKLLKRYTRYHPFTLGFFMFFLCKNYPPLLSQTKTINHLPLHVFGVKTYFSGHPPNFPPNGPQGSLFHINGLVLIIQILEVPRCQPAEWRPKISWAVDLWDGGGYIHILYICLDQQKWCSDFDVGWRWICWKKRWPIWDSESWYLGIGKDMAWRLEQLRNEVCNNFLSRWNAVNILRTNDRMEPVIGKLVGGFKYFLFSSLFGEMIQFD